MAIRQIQHPDVEIREIDRSQVAPTIVGTSVLAMGFANKGEAFVPVMPVSISDLEANFGLPTNEAERYFHYACREVILEGGNLTAIRLPYDNDMEDNYKCIALTLGTASAFSNIVANTGSTSAELSGAISSLSNYSSITLAREVQIGSVGEITNENYDSLVTGGGYSGSGHFLIVNEKKMKLTGGVADSDANEGIFVSVISPWHGMLVQRVAAGSDSDPLKIVTGLSGSTFTQSLTGKYSGSSISETLMRYFPTIEFASSGADVSTDLFDWLTIVVSKTVADPNEDGRLTIVPLEWFSGSLKIGDKDKSTGQSVYLPDVINAQSNYIKMWRTDLGASLSFVATEFLWAKAKAIDFLAFDASSEGAPDISYTQLPTDIDTALSKVANINEREIDVVLDAGLSSIAQLLTNSGDTSSGYDPLTLSGVYQNLTDGDDTSAWRSICSDRLVNFCANVRKDCMAVLDAPRTLAVKAETKLLRKTSPTSTFSNTVSPKLKYISGINSNYAALYSDWFRIYDSYSGRNVWMPPSVKVGGVYVRNDRVGEIWDAPAGLNRGVLNGVNDLAFNPEAKDCDRLYGQAFNYAKQYPLEGFILEGQKTTQVKPSAFDRVNVRRLFLRLERLVYKVCRYFVYEPNNDLTRRRLIATIQPTFDSIKVRGGLYDYRIVCDASNNTPEVIDNNELRIAFLLQPVKTAEFIVVDFVALRTGGGGFNESI